MLLAIQANCKPISLCMHRSIAISQNTLTRLSQEIQAFTEEHPRAKGLSKFRQRIKQGIRSLLPFCILLSDLHDQDAQQRSFQRAQESLGGSLKYKATDSFP